MAVSNEFTDAISFLRAGPLALFGAGSPPSAG